MFIGLLTGIVSVTNHTECVSLGNQKFTTQPTVVNLHPNEHTQGLHHYLFLVNLNRCVGSCNTHNNMSNKVCASRKAEDLNLSMFDMNTGINK